MRSFFRVALTCLALIVAVSVASCGDNEPAERKAFIEFLQTRIVDKPGVHVPKPTDADIKSFGPYAEQYKIITDFTADPEMMAISQQMTQAIRAGAPRSLQDVVSRQQDIQTIRESLAKMRAPLDQKFAAAEAARDALKQPPDLKTVFSAAFERDVGDPARAFQSALPIVDDALGGVLKVAAYINSHRDAVKINGSTIEVRDPKVQAELNGLLQGLNAKGQQLNEQQRKLHAMLSGS
jgi:hypothetical protein